MAILENIILNKTGQSQIEAIWAYLFAEAKKKQFNPANDREGSLAGSGDVS